MNRIGLCCAILVCVIGCIESSPILRTVDSGENQCKDLCMLCNCIGFYCGDECICECNSLDYDNVNCVDSMQDKCESAQSPYQVLIQGPTGSRFVRSLMASDPPADPKSRLTISVFQPSKADEQAVDVSPSEKHSSSKEVKTEHEGKEIKREIDSLDDKPAGKKGEKIDKTAEKTDDKVDELDEKQEKNENKRAANDSTPTTEATENKKEQHTDEPSLDETDNNKSHTTEVSGESDKVIEDAPADSDAAPATQNADSQQKKDLKKRAVNTELEESVAESVNQGDQLKPVAASTEPTVGSGLPLLPLSLSMLPLKARLDALKTQINLSRGAPILSPINPGLLPLQARLADLTAKTRLGALGLLPLAPPVFPGVPSIL